MIHLSLLVGQLKLVHRLETLIYLNTFFITTKALQTHLMLLPTREELTFNTK